MQAKINKNCMADGIRKWLHTVIKPNRLEVAMIGFMKQKIF